MRSGYGESVIKGTSISRCLKFVVTILPDAGIHRKWFCMLVNSYGLWMLENDEKHFLVIMHKKVLFSLSSFTSFTLHSGKRCDRISFGGVHVSPTQRQSKTSVRRVGTKDRRRYGKQILCCEGTGRSRGAS